jgi:hypothetical protein
LFLKTDHGCIITNPNQTVLQCNENIPVHRHPKSSNFKVTPLAGKVMLTVFWDSQRVLLSHFQKRGEDVNSASNCEVLLKLRNAIHRKRTTTRPTGKRGTASSWQCQTPYSPSNPGRNSRTTRTVGTSWPSTARVWPLVTSIGLVR